MNDDCATSSMLSRFYVRTHPDVLSFFRFTTCGRRSCNGPKVPKRMLNGRAGNGHRGGGEKVEGGGGYQW